MLLWMRIHRGIRLFMRETPKACSSLFCFYQISCKKHTFSGIRKALPVVKNMALHIL